MVWSTVSATKIGDATLHAVDVSPAYIIRGGLKVSGEQEEERRSKGDQ